jgi:hypothetical protein
METPAEKKPFHESIVDAIHCAFGADLPCLAALIKTTKVPKNHDEIIKAWKERLNYLGHAKEYGVSESVAGQKPLDRLKIMYSAKDLKTAIELGFVHIPQGSNFVGPQGKVWLVRNDPPADPPIDAELLVKEIGDRTIFRAYQGQNDKTFKLESPTGEKIEDWNDQW